MEHYIFVGKVSPNYYFSVRILIAMSVLNLSGDEAPEVIIYHIQSDSQTSPESLCCSVHSVWSSSSWTTSTSIPAPVDTRFVSALITCSESHFTPQICRFCWNKLRTEGNGLCPACRQGYTENPADFKPLTSEEMAKIKVETGEQQNKTFI